MWWSFHKYAETIASSIYGYWNLIKSRTLEKIQLILLFELPNANE